MKLLVTGHLGRAHALGGEIALSAYNPGSPLWRPGVELALLAPIDAAARAARADAGESEVVDDGEEVVGTIVLKDLRATGGDRLLARFEGVTDRSAAEALRGHRLAVPLEVVEALEGPADDEFYFYEVPGWQVVTTDGRVVGTVVRALSTHIDLVEVRPAGGGETFYLPMIADVITSVDRSGRRLVIDPLEGLLP